MAVTFYHDQKIKKLRDFQIISRCLTGEIFTGKLISLKADKYTFQSTVLKAGEIEGEDAEMWKTHKDGLIIEIPTSKLLKLTFRYGNFAYLSDISPEKAEEFPFFGGKGAVADPSKYWWKYKMDKSVTGSELALTNTNGKRVNVTKGIGVHSYSKLSFNLQDNYEVFMADIGVEASAGRQASVIFRVFCDDEKKAKYESPIIRRSAGFISIKVDITKAKVIHLEVDFADNGDIQDRAVWGRARIFKKDTTKKDKK